MFAGGEYDINTAFPIMPYYRHKQRHVRRVVEVDPDFGGCMIQILLMSGPGGFTPG
jgi:hypothetical protein